MNTYHAVIGPRLATEGEGSLRDTFVDDTIGKHRLGSDSKDESGRNISTNIKG